MSRVSIIIFLSFLFVSTGYTQNFSITQFRAADGLDTDMIKCVAQDKLGFVWIGSDDGLMKYDGIEFTHYPGAAPSTYYKDMLVCSDGRVLAAHDLGVMEIKSSLDGATFETVLSGSTTRNDSTIWYPKKLFEDSQGHIWISEPQSVVRHMGDSWERFDFGPEDNSTSFVRSFDFLQFTPDSLLISSYHGNFYLYRHSTGKLQAIKSERTDILVNTMNTINGNHFVGTDSDLYQLNIDKGRVALTSLGMNMLVTDVVELDEQSFLVCGENTVSYEVVEEDGGYFRIPIQSLDLPINQAFKSHGGEIWLSTMRGLIVMRVPQFRTIELTVPRVYIEGIIADTTSNRIYAISKESIWVVDMISEHLLAEYSFPGGYFLSGVMARGGLWVSNEFELWNIKNGEVVHKLDYRDEGRYLFDVFKDKFGNLWVSQEAANGVKYIDLNSFRFSWFNESKGAGYNITAIAEDDQGIYLATNDPQAYLLFKSDTLDRFVNYAHEHTLLNEGFIIEDLTVLGEDIWIASNQGLLKHSKDSLEQIRFNSSLDGLGLRTQTNDSPHLWFGNSLGVFRYNTETGAYSQFNEKTGMPINSVNEESLVIAGNKVWVGTPYGLTVMNYEDQNYEKTKAPYFLKFEVNGNDYSGFTEVPEVSFSSFIEFTFSSLSFPSEEIQYSYRVPEMGEEWSPPIQSSSLELAELAQGTYHVEVRAKKIGNHTWSDISSFEFIVLPGFYNTPLFYVLIVAVIVLFSLVTRSVTRQVMKKRQEMLQKMIDDRTKELKEYRDNLEILVKERTDELKETQKHLLQAEKMASLGTLTAGVAHEINNPVNYIQAGLYSLKSLLGNAKEFKDNAELGDTVSQVTTNMQQGVDRVTNIVRSLGNFSRQNLSEKVDCDLNAVLDDCLLLLSHETKNKCEVIKNYRKGGLHIKGDETKLHQLFTNVISNSIQAIEESGTIEITTEKRADGIYVIISDDGCGIDPGHLDRLFDPFFTTKPPGKGTGLGLYISLMIAEEHNARIQFEPRNEKGTRTMIIFG